MAELQKLRADQTARVEPALPTVTRMRYWKPAPALSGLVSGYHLYAVQGSPDKPHHDVFQPAWTNLRIVLTPGTVWRVRIGAGSWQMVETCALFGPTSRVTWSQSTSGVVVGAGITPKGWARLTKQDASRWANRVDSCEAVFGSTVAALRPMLSACPSDDALPLLLDAFLIGAMSRPTRLDTAIARLETALLNPEITSARALASRVGTAPRTLERLASRAFGFPPGLLLRRARFLRSLHAIRQAGPHNRNIAIDAGYTDYSHFVHEAHAFLGMSPGAFLKLDMPLFKQSAALRQTVLGAPAQALGPTSSSSYTEAKGSAHVQSPSQQAIR